MAFPLHHGSKFQPFLVLLSFSLGLTFLACGGGEDQTPTDPGAPEPEVSTIEVSPSSAELNALKATRDFEATARDQNGNTMSGVSFNWSISPDSVGSIDNNGTATAESDGSATVEAEAEGVTGSASLTVHQMVADVEVGPGDVSVEAVGDTVHFSAEARDANGHPVPDARPSWSSSDTSVVTVDSTGVATAQGEGTARVRAEAEGVADSSSFAVDQQVGSVSVSPDSATLTEEGATQDFDATAEDINGNTMSGISYAWSSTDTSVATVDSTGLATARGEGEASIEAKAQGVQGQSQLHVNRVTPLPKPVNRSLPPRFFSMAVWDSEQNRMLVYGGNARRLHNELWAYDPEAGRWSKVDGIGPLRRMSGAAWGNAQHRMLVFGGDGGNPIWRRGTGPSNDLLSYNQADGWSTLDPSGDGPDVSGLPSTVWDSGGGRLLIFGGHRGDKRANSNQLWAYQSDENRWASLSPENAAPTARHGHSAVWRSETAEMVVFGGWNPAHGRFNRLWSYSAEDNRWKELNTNSPPRARFRHSAVWDPVQDKMLVYGGCCVPGMHADLWRFDFETKQWTELQPTGPAPPGRQKHVAVWDPVHEAMLVYGGSSGQCFFHNDLWAYVPRNNEWISLSPDARTTLGRMEHDAAWAADKAYVFGGCQGSTATNQIMAFNPASQSLTLLKPDGSRPEGRKEHSLVAIPSDSTLLMFAGQGSEGRFNDLWEFDPAEQRWIELTPGGNQPAPRFDHAAVWTPGRQQMLVFGGLDNSRFYGDLWAYSLNDGTWTKLSSDSRGPGRRSDAEAVWDPVHKQMIIHGGWWVDLGSGGAKDEFNDTWAYRPESDEWVQLNDGGSNAPGFRQEFSLTWDTHEEKALLFGGFAFQAEDLLEDELWNFDPSSGSWTELQPPSPRPSRRSDHKTVWNPQDAEMLLLGGIGGEQGRFLNQVWSYQSQANSWDQIYP